MNYIEEIRNFVPGCEQEEKDRALMLAAWLLENGRDDACNQLLAWHLLPWAPRFLAEFIEKANHPFFIALGKLAQQTLAHWQSSLLIPVADKKLYR